MSLTRDVDTLQPLVDQTTRLQPQRYFSDGYEAYKSLLYPHGQHAVAPGKSETYSVEGDNADLRHYLARICGIAGHGSAGRAGAFHVAWKPWHVR